MQYASRVGIFVVPFHERFGREFWKSDENIYDDTECRWSSYVIIILSKTRFKYFFRRNYSPLFVSLSTSHPYIIIRALFPSNYRICSSVSRIYAHTHTRVCIYTCHELERACVCSIRHRHYRIIRRVRFERATRNYSDVSTYILHA